MRTFRQSKILDIINGQEVETQEQLVELLCQAGFPVTQATISRDIRELKLVKLLSKDGHYRYAGTTEGQPQAASRFIVLFQETVQSVASSGNIIVIKTLSGCANAAGEAIDNLNIPHVLGSIAGDNTLMMIVDHPNNVQELMNRFHHMMQDQSLKEKGEQNDF